MIGRELQTGYIRIQGVVVEQCQQENMVADSKCIVEIKKNGLQDFFTEHILNKGFLGHLQIAKNGYRTRHPRARESTYAVTEYSSETPSAR